jgi:hypothetical protein
VAASKPEPAGVNAHDQGSASCKYLSLREGITEGRELNSRLYAWMQRMSRCAWLVSILQRDVPVQLISVMELLRRVSAVVFHGLITPGGSALGILKHVM